MRCPSLFHVAVTAALLAGGCWANPGLTEEKPGSAEASSWADWPSGTRADAQRVPAFRETWPVPHRGDAADDPAIWIHPSRGRYLVASNQGRNSYAVYRRGNVDEYITTFRVVAGRGVDGVRDTDGVEATARPLGSDFPAGLFVAQDGHNRGANQNFKLVRWDLAAIVGEAGRGR